MKYITLPNTDITCSALCYGPALAGTLLSEEDTFRLLDKFVELGGNIIDTAHVYANWLDMGMSMSEKTIGKWLNSRGINDEVFVATKGGHFAFETPNVSRVTRDEVYKDIQESLEYLQKDCIDIYWLHRDNPQLPAGEIAEFMHEFHQKGFIREFGGSNWTASRLKEAIDYAKNNNLKPFTSVQNMWSLAELSKPLGDSSLVFCQKEDLDFYLNAEISLFAYSSQAHGFFGILAENGQEALQEHTKNSYYNKANLRRLEIVEDLAKKYDCRPNDIALAYMISQNFACLPVFNTSNIQHLEYNMEAGNITLSQDDVKLLSNLL